MIVRALLNFGVRGGAAAAGLALHVVVARTLGPTGSGAFFLLLSIMLLTSEVGRIGIHQSIIRFVAPRAGPPPSPEALAYVGSAAALVAAGGVAAAAAISLLSLAALPTLLPARAELWPLAAAFVWLAPAMGLLTLSAAVAQALSRPLTGSVIEVGLTPVLATAAILALGLVGAAGLGTVALGHMTAGALAALAALAAMRRRLGGPVRAEASKAREIFAASHPLLAANLMRFALQNAPLLIMGATLTLEETGVFSVAHRLSMTMGILAVAVNGVVYPRLAVAFHDGDSGRMQRDLRLSAAIALGAGLPILLGLALFRAEVLQLFGPTFGAGGAMLLILLAGQSVTLLAASSNALLAMAGQERALRRNLGVAALASVALSAALIPLLGAFGGAVALAAATALQSGLAMAATQRRLGVGVLPPLRGR